MTGDVPGGQSLSGHIACRKHVCAVAKIRVSLASPVIDQPLMHLYLQSVPGSSQIETCT